MNSIILAIGADLTTQPYINKLSKILKANNCDVEYLFWDRLSPPSSSSSSIKSNALYRGFSKNKIVLLLHYVLWSFSILKYLAIYSNKSTTYFLSRIDTALPAYIISYFKKINYVYLDRDAAHMTYNLGAIKPLVFMIEKSVAKRALIHVIPGKSRDFTFFENVRIVSNTPLTSELSSAKTFFLNRGGRTDFRKTIYINGWLSEMRGISFILNAIKGLSKDDFRFIIAGAPACSDAESLISLPNIEYLGLLSNSEALSYYMESDLVLSFYDPSLEINRKAEPNKWYDCACLGVKFLTNHGIQTSDYFSNTGLCHIIEYGNSVQLSEFLKGIPLNGRTTPNYAPETSSNFPPWDISFSKIIIECKHKININ